MKTKELRSLPPEELKRRLIETREEEFNLRFRLATKQLQNFQELKRVRKDIARIKTIIREREIYGQEA
jgi:large subunit ribosomal protein L29